MNRKNVGGVHQGTFAPVSGHCDKSSNTRSGEESTCSVGWDGVGDTTQSAPMPFQRPKGLKEKTVMSVSCIKSRGRESNFIVDRQLR